MTAKDVIELLGTITAISFGIAILNYFIKLIHKRFIMKLGKDKKQFADFYRKVMKVIVKYHKTAGIIAIASLLTHFAIAFSTDNIRITGIISAILMMTLGGLGMYGAFINKNLKAVWLKTHRIVAFLLVIAVGAHMIIKQ